MMMRMIMIGMMMMVTLWTAGVREGKTVNWEA